MVVMDNISNKKKILQLIIKKKLAIENNYYSISRIIDDILFESNDEMSIELANKKQVALEDATNFAISLLERIIQYFIDSLNETDSQKSKEIEEKMQQTFNQLEQSTSDVSGNNIQSSGLDIESVNSDSSSELPSELGTHLANSPIDSVNEFGLSDFDKYDKSSKINEWDHLNNESNNLRDAPHISTVDNVLNNISLDEIAQLRGNGELIDNLNDLPPRELADFENIHFNEVESYHDFKEFQRNSANSPIGRPSDKGFEKYNINPQLLDLENRLMDEINALKQSNNVLTNTNDSLVAKLNSTLPNVFENKKNENETLNALDIAVNNMISKIEIAKLPDFHLQNIENLEKVSQNIIKSLENNLEQLSTDVKNLKEENISYKKTIDEYVNVINSLKNESILKEQELNESYSAWVFSNKKLQDLELLLDQQSIDIDELDGQKNHIIDSLEKKLLLTIEDLNSALTQNEELINRQTELEEFIRINDIQSEYSVETFNSDIEAKTIEELVENEANRIVDKKLSAMIDRYKNELEVIELKAKESINHINENKHILEVEFENKRKEESEIIKFLEDKIKSFEVKISVLEKNIKNTEFIENKTRKTIDILNDSINGDEYNLEKEKEFNSSVNSKLNSLEKLIYETIEKINDSNNNDLNQTKNEIVLTQQEHEDIVLNSSLYKNVLIEVQRLHEKIIYLKNENELIKKENYEINKELDISLSRFNSNNNKIGQIENLIDLQISELEKLNNEKNELIDTLEQKILDFSQFNEYYKDQYLNDDKNKIHQYDENFERVSVEQLVNDKVEELLSSKLDEIQQNNNDYVQNNEKLEENKIDSVEEKEVKNIVESFVSHSIEFNNKLNELNDLEPVKYNEEIKDSNDLLDHNFDDGIVTNIDSQIQNIENYIDSNGDYKIAEVNEFYNNNFGYDASLTDEIINNVSENNKKEVLQNNDEKINPMRLNNSIIEDLQKNETILIQEIARLQKEKEDIIAQNALPKEIIKEKVVYKHIQSKIEPFVPRELIESNEKLKKFEKLLMQIDGEVSNIENNYLDSFINNL